MDNDAIQKLADQIKSKEERAALSQQIQLHKAEFIKANCRSFFDTLSAELKAAVSQLNEALAGAASADPPVVFKAPTGVSIQIAKDDFPSTSASLTLNTNGLRMDFVVHSSQRKDVPPQHNSLGFLAFDVNPENQLVVRTKDQKVYSSAKDLAESIMESTFTIA